MNTVEKLKSQLGRPQVLREVGSGDRPLAAIGSWRHKGACVDLSDIDTFQLVFNVSGGQLVERRCGDRSVRSVARAGSIGVVSLGNPTSVVVTGRADTVHSSDVFHRHGCGGDLLGRNGARAPVSRHRLV
jgi:hypothetical protein